MMWMPLVGPLPQPKWFGIPAKIGYLIGVRFTGIVLGNVFMWANSAFYPDYAPGEARWHLSAVTDQSIAGVIMMVEGGFVTLGVLSWLFLEWAKQDTERQRLLDLAEQRGVPLSEASRRARGRRRPGGAARGAHQGVDLSRERRQIRRADQRPSAAMESARSMEKETSRPGAPV